jgi:ABC-type dipeptide/oligopeptide/nickel transport system permease component
MNNKNSSRYHSSRDHPGTNALQSYLDRTLDPAQRAQIQGHLDRCPGCREQLMRLERLYTRLEGLPELPLQRDFSRAVLEEIESEKRVSLQLTWTAVLQAVIAGIVLGLALPFLRGMSWLSQLSGFQPDMGSLLSLFLSRLAADWLGWWLDLQETVRGFLVPLTAGPPASLTADQLWPWMLFVVLAAIAANSLLLRDRSGIQINQQK